SMPATADLLAVIARLPQGAVVLPGLDTESDEATWRAIDAGPDDPGYALAQAHPQFGLAHLLRRLGIGRAAVRPWPSPGVAGAGPSRARTLARALAPASCTEALRGAPIDAAGFAGVTLLQAASPEEEARSVALVMRRTLEEPGRTAALVTPDRTLARRVGAELTRWGIAVDDSGGRPLAETPPAAFLRLIGRMVAETFAPVPLLAALQHPLAAGGRAPAAFRANVRALERLALRGLRPAPGIDGLRRVLTTVKGDASRAAFLLDTLDSAVAPLVALFNQGAVSLAAILAAHGQAAETLARSNTETGAARLWAGDDGEALAGFVAELADAARHDPPIAPADWPELLDVLLAGRVVRPRWGRHPRLAVWGPLEARLQCADVMILGGLNEESWPPATHAGPWMSRPMLQDFGLPLPERRIGLSAHDFCQAFAAPAVWLTRAERREGAPTVPCRWLLRLKALLHDSGWPEASAERAAPILHWQRLLDAPATIAPVRPPAPTPPLAARPRALSVTQVETLIRDPYAVYARHILRLRPLDLLDA
ncbi:MAG TPA: double-strand break repair protein AddB, partial [Rhodospirillales bacterium]|nr:double-strand break repair protein AddB [Rhodospirillales bacterium]